MNLTKVVNAVTNASPSDGAKALDRIVGLKGYQLAQQTWRKYKTAHPELTTKQLRALIAKQNPCNGHPG